MYYDPTFQSIYLVYESPKGFQYTLTVLLENDYFNVDNVYVHDRCSRVFTIHLSI